MKYGGDIPRVGLTPSHDWLDKGCAKGSLNKSNGEDEENRRMMNVGDLFATHCDNQPKEDDIREIIPWLRES